MIFLLCLPVPGVGRTMRAAGAITRVLVPILFKHPASVAFETYHVPHMSVRCVRGVTTLTPRRTALQYGHSA